MPQISFQSGDNKDVPVTVEQKNIAFQGPLVNGNRLGMGHGPVVVAIILPAGAEATLTLHWVSGNVYGHGTCVTPEALQLSVTSSTLQTPFERSICGADANHVTMAATRFSLDPQL